MKLFIINGEPVLAYSVQQALSIYKGLVNV